MRESSRGREPNGPGTMLFGAGAQKAGTTWLFDYLAASPQVQVGYRKEFHVFDALDLPSEAWMQRKIWRRARQTLGRAAAGEPADAGHVHQASMLLDPDLYFDYFTSLLARPGIRLTADMTVDYALLSPERMRRVRNAFDRRGLRTVSIFSMRDPVERIWSQARMRAQRRPNQYPGPVEEWVRRGYDQPDLELRTRYDVTIAALDEVFGPDDVHYVFYERLFDVSEVQRICEFLGIDTRDPDFATYSNRTAKDPAGLSEETIGMVAVHYRDLYDAISQRFGISDLAQLWPSARYAR